MPDLAPSPTEPDGQRDPLGRFRPGNKCSRGNPMARKVAAVRKALFAAVRPADIRDVVAALLRQAKAGKIEAIRELLDRLLGKATVMIAEPDRPDEAPGEIVFTIVPSVDDDRPDGD